MRLIFNLTLTYNWRKSAVGIVRVEKELLENLYNSLGNKLIPVIFEGNTCYQITEKALITCLSPEWSDPENNIIFKNDKIIFVPDVNDRFISIGSDWSFNIPDKVFNLYPNSRNLVTVCYDLIPLLFPELTPDDSFFTQFTYHYDLIRRIALKVFCISNNTQNDLLNYWIEHKDDIPEVVTLPLANLPINNSSIELTHDDTFLTSLINQGGYIMYVSTLEPRKNHKLLINIWKNLFICLGKNCPNLLFVGKIGWGVIDLLNEVNRLEPNLKNKIIIRDDIDDEYLKVLYQHCLFTVNPSLYEGWGLAATETLSYGKFTLCSNNSAFQEATQNLALYYHPLDLPQWQETIETLVLDKKKLLSLENTINSNFKYRDWNDFTQDFIRWVMK